MAVVVTETAVVAGEISAAVVVVAFVDVAAVVIVVATVVVVVSGAIGQKAVEAGSSFSCILDRSKMRHI